MNTRSLTLGTGLMAVLIVSTGCASTRVTAFKDPEFAGRSFGKPAVYANTANLEWRQSLEDRLVAEMSKHGVIARATFQLIPPTRDQSPEERAQILLAHGIDALIVIEVGESGVKDQYIPPTGATTTTHGTVTTYGSIGTYRGTSYTRVHGGYNVSKPWAEMSTYVLEVATGRKAWVANSFTSGNAFASFKGIRESYAKKIVQQLLSDEVVAGGARMP